MAAQPIVTLESQKDDRLDSWKEIAAFLRRGVRTVQRWERTERLPVHRHQHDKLGSVYALRSEVAAWWDSRGTQLLPVAGRERAGGARHPVRDPGKEKTRSRLLVLPFVNLSGDAGQEFLSDGLTEEMISRLARLEPERLGVIARSTAMSYKPGSNRAGQIAAELDLDYILEGSVRAAGTRLRVTAQLVETREHTHIWAQTYDRDLSDVFALQADVAEAIAREVRVVLPAAPAAAVDAEAYKAFLMGRYLMNRMTAAGLAQSLEWFERAVEKDPTLALAHAGIAQAYGLLATVPFDALAPHEAMPKAAAAARRALELDPSLPEAHAALGLVLHHYEWNWAEAERAYQRALELNPDYSAALLRYAWLLLALGRAADALAMVERAQAIAEEIDPHLMVVVRATRAAAFYFARDFDRSIAECRDAINLDPSDFLLHFLLGRALLRKGLVRQGAAAFKVRKAAWDDVPLMAAGAGLALALAGQKTAASSILRRLKEQKKSRNIPATYLGILCAGLRDEDAALGWFEKAYEERADGMTLLNAEPMSDGMRKDPRFQDLVRRMGLVPA
ncbi:MAG TPA: tetratricopeptide repeat protein [Candidatus Acidoferrales bacterium]|nr:tetratricopeptide repeat protein [Candidatus Acidoferrales bacterium]